MSETEGTSINNIGAPTNGAPPPPPPSDPTPLTTKPEGICHYCHSHMPLQKYKHLNNTDCFFECGHCKLWFWDSSSTTNKKADAPAQNIEHVSLNSDHLRLQNLPPFPAVQNNPSTSFQVEPEMVPSKSPIKMEQRRKTTDQNSPHAPRRSERLARKYRVSYLEAADESDFGLPLKKEKFPDEEIKLEPMTQDENGSLRRHGKTHTNESRFVCPVCGKVYTRKFYFLRHQKSAHQENTKRTPGENTSDMAPNVGLGVNNSSSATQSKSPGLLEEEIKYSQNVPTYTCCFCLCSEKRLEMEKHMMTTHTYISSYI